MYEFQMDPDWIQTLTMNVDPDEFRSNWIKNVSDGSELFQWLTINVDPYESDNWWFLEMCKNKPFLDIYEFTDNSDQIQTLIVSVSDNKCGSRWIQIRFRH